MAKMKTMEINGKDYVVLPPEKILESECVESVISQVRGLEKTIIKAKEKIVEQVDKLLNDTAQRYGKKWKGNAHLFNLEQTFEVAVKISEKVKMGKELSLANQFYDRWLERISVGSQPAYKKVVNNTFKTDSDGYVCKTQLMKLRKMDGEGDEDKASADELIDKAIIDVIKTKYITFFDVDGDGGKTKIEVNFSAI